MFVLRENVWISKKILHEKNKIEYVVLLYKCIIQNEGSYKK